MQINPSIFREYDIRGITETEHSPALIAEYEKWYGAFPGVTLTTKIARAIGQVYASKLREKGGARFIIGHEIRPYSEEIKSAFIEGALAAGCDVIDAGVSLTPLLYFANAHLGFDGAVSVTGSHNVYFFNGFKLMGKNNEPFYGQELQKWHELCSEEPLPTASHPGKLSTMDIFPTYLSYLKKLFTLPKPLKIVIDCGNGTPGNFAPKLFESLGCQVAKLYCEPDATFPNHLPDPEDPFMLHDLSDKVTEIGADLGLAFDADADRFGSVDETGQFIPADQLISLLARDYLSRHQNKKILYDVKCSRHLDSIIADAHGKPLMHQTGHAPIKHTFRADKDVIFGGEISGHMYFVEDYFAFDDGLFAAAKTLHLLAHSQQSYSQLFSFFPSSIMTPEIKLPCSDSTKHLVVQAIQDKFSETYPVVTIDGCRINFTDSSWALVRASNTAPYLTIRLEADSVPELLRVKNILADVFETHASILDRLDRSTVTSRTGKLGWV